MVRSILCFALSFATVSLQAAEPVKPGTGADKLGWKLTMQSWTMQKGPKPSTVFEAIDVSNKLGVHFLEIYPGQPIGSEDKAAKFGPGMTEAQIKEVLDKAKANDITIIDTGVIGIPAKEADARKVFDWAKKVGITTIVSEPDPKALPMIDKIAGEYGIKVALHDHPKPSVYWDPEYAFSLVRNLPNVGLCADVGHWKRSGFEPADVLQKYGEKVFSSHFKDLNKDKQDVVWGQGLSKAAAMLAALKEKKFKGPIAIEFESNWDLPKLQKCVEFFNQEADKLAAE